MPDYPDVSDNPADELVPSVLPREPEPPPLAPALGEGPEAVPVAGEVAPGAAQIGVLLVNLGTPDAANAAAVRRYLKEFLTDPRVIEKNSPLWRIALNGVILPFRSRRKVRDYRKIWNRERDESPIKTITRSQAEQLANLLKPLGSTLSLTGRCATPRRRLHRVSRHLSNAAATAFWSCRSIRNTRRRPRRP